MKPEPGGRRGRLRFAAGTSFAVTCCQIGLLLDAFEGPCMAIYNLAWLSLGQTTLAFACPARTGTKWLVFDIFVLASLKPDVNFQEHTKLRP